MRFLDSGLAHLPTLQNYFPLHKTLQKALSCREERHCKMQTNQSIYIKEWEKSITPLSLEESHYLIALTDLSPPYLKGKICRLERASCPHPKPSIICLLSPRRVDVSKREGKRQTAEHKLLVCHNLILGSLK